MAYFKHPTAVVESDAIGDGTQIWHFAHIREGAVLGTDCNVGKGVYVDTDVRIGNNVKVQNFVSIYRGVVIGDDVFVGPSVTFTNDLYPRAFIWDDGKIVPTSVKKGASIGANSTILCGITIGAYAMIGAGSTVTKDVLLFGLVYGNPARLHGFVCYCGRKLSRILRADGDKTIYECECGKEVEIKKSICIETTRLHKINTEGGK